MLNVTKFWLVLFQFEDATFIRKKIKKNFCLCNFVMVFKEMFNFSIKKKKYFYSIGYIPQKKIF